MQLSGPARLASTLAIQFAKHRIEVMLANSRRPSTLTDLAVI
ncbi:hypothetical protein [Mesorhizobium sp. B2-3-5]|nr:hypothetical protein [Mesorhizobium sp. B2-3-5]